MNLASVKKTSAFASSAPVGEVLYTAELGNPAVPGEAEGGRVSLRPALTRTGRCYGRM